MDVSPDSRDTIVKKKASDESIPQQGWRKEGGRPSLAEVYHSVPVPAQGGPFWRRLLAFIGPGYLIAVGYMDPGNWATDISGGSLFNYTLLSVIVISNLLAIFLQALSAKLGIVAGRDLAQACRDAYRKPVVIALWLSAEIAIIACEIAEVLGAAIALNLLFHIPLLLGVVLTSLDVVVVLALQHKGFRWIEALVIVLIGTMMAIFGMELVYSRPDWMAVLHGIVPDPQILHNREMLYISLGILGATVMPHNLYLHSSIVQTRRYSTGKEGLKEAIRYATTDSTVALMLALLVNAAILIVAASTFYRSGHHEIGDIEHAFQALSPLLGVALASKLFAVALLAAGQNATLTGTLASQIVLEGFINVRLAPWMLRMLSRALAIIPSAIAIAWYGEKGTGALLVFSQVILSLQLPLAVIPLVQFTSDSKKMGAFANGALIKAIGWLVALIIAGLNIYLIFAYLAHK